MGKLGGLTQVRFVRTSSNAIHAYASQAVSFRSTIGKPFVQLLLLMPMWFALGLGFLPFGGIKAVVGALLVAAAFAQAIRAIDRCPRYVIVDETLVIHRATKERRIHLASIVSVRRRTGREILDLPSDDFAWGTNILEIRYNGDSKVLVSPRDEDAFLAAIGQPLLADTP